MNPNTFNKITRLLNGESFITKEPGNSMLPLYKSNEEHLLTPITWEQCKVGDVVFCKVKGSCFTHKVYAIDPKKVVLTGAGISAESGIPTFRDAVTGLWENHRVEDVATHRAIVEHPDVVYNFMNELRKNMQDVSQMMPIKS